MSAHSHDRLGQALLATILGFSLSYSALLLAGTVSNGALRSQLIAGGLFPNSELPTTLNTVKTTSDRISVASSIVGSYAFWPLVVFGGIVLSLVLLRFLYSHDRIYAHE